MDVRDQVRNINWNEVEQDLLRIFSNEYRKIWVQYTRFGSVCITCFPLNRFKDYEIFTFFKISDWTVENLTSLVKEEQQKRGL